MNQAVKLEELPVMGSIGPMPDGRDIPYWQALAENRLVLQHCPDCARWIWGAAWRCSYCGCFELEWKGVEPEGIVYSWIRTWQAFRPEFAPLVPYVTVLAELPQAGGKRVLGLLTGPDAGVGIGARVRAVIQPASDRTGGYAVLRWQLI